MGTIPCATEGNRSIGPASGDLRLCGVAIADKGHLQIVSLEKCRKHVARNRWPSGPRIDAGLCPEGVDQFRNAAGGKTIRYSKRKHDLRGGGRPASDRARHRKEVCRSGAGRQVLGADIRSSDLKQAGDKSGEKQRVSHGPLHLQSLLSHARTSACAAWQFLIQITPVAMRKVGARCRLLARSCRTGTSALLSLSGVDRT